MKLTGIQRVLSVDKNMRARAAIAYVKTMDGYCGAYYGYAGGGAYDDGYFFMSEYEDVITSSDLDDLPQSTQKLCEELSAEVQSLLDHDDEEGGLSDKGKDLKNKGTIFHSPSGWEHRSHRVTQKILRLVSKSWSLSMRWH